MEPIFVYARTTDGQLFESYVDYWRMVRMWGYKTCELSEIAYEDNGKAYIWSSPIGRPQQVFEHEKARNRLCRLILWDLEWPRWIKGRLSDLAGKADPVDEVWVSDKHLFNLWKRFEPATFSKVRFLVLGGHPEFGLNTDYESREFHWDFSHLLYLTGVRGQRFHEIREAGNSMAPATFNMDERHHHLSHSRWGLNLHQNPLPCLSPQRFMIFASYKLPIITDYCADPYPFVVFQDALSHYDPRRTRVSNLELRTEAIETNYKMITETHSFKAEVDRLIKSCESDWDE